MCLHSVSTALPLRAQMCAHRYNKIRDSLLPFPIFVCSQRLINRNVAKLFSSNYRVSHLNEAFCIDELSRGSASGPEILIAFGFSLP